MVRLLAILAALAAAAPSYAQVIDTGENNPEVEILYPKLGQKFLGFYLVEMRNIDYTPENATSAGSQFAVGHDKNGDPLFQNVGHLHGWVFEVDKHGNMVRNDAGRPTPGSYFRFYGAGGAQSVGFYDKRWYLLWDDLPKGNYQVFFQAQQNDHTPMRQSGAPAFPAIATSTFKSR